MVNNITILNIHGYKKLNEKVLNLTLMERVEAFEEYRKPITAKLQFIERDRFLQNLLRRYLAKEIGIFMTSLLTVEYFSQTSEN